MFNFFLAILLFFQTPDRVNSSPSTSINGDLPVLLAPSDGALINYQPSFDWKGSTWVPYGNNIVVDDDPAFASPELDLRPFSSQCNPAADLPDGQYYWHVRIMDSFFTWGDFSPTWSFTIDTAPPPAPWQTGGWNANTGQPVIWWGPSSADSVAYELTVFRLDDLNDVNGTEVIDVTVDSPTYTPDTPLVDGEYIYKVRARDMAGNWGDFSEIVFLGIDTVPPPVPTLLTPADGSLTHEPRPQFDWTDSSTTGMITYQLLVDNDPAFSSPEINTNINWDSIYMPDFNYTNPVNTTLFALADGSYYWKVRARDSAGNWSSYSPTWSFTLAALPPSVPVLYTPADGAVLSDNTPLLDWTDSAGDPTSYRLDVYHFVNTGNGPVTVPVVATGTTLSFYRPVTPLADGEYDWHVSAWRVRQDGVYTDPSDYSLWGTFTIDTSQAQSLPAGMVVGDGDMVTFYDLHGTELAKRQVTGISLLAPGQMHLAGSLAQGADNLQLVYSSRQNGPALESNMNNHLSMLAAEPGLVSILGMPGNPYLAFVRLDAQSSGMNRLYAGGLADLASLQPRLTWSPGPSDFGDVILPLAIHSQAGQVRGIWFTNAGEGGNNLAFQAYNGLEYLDFSNNQVVEFINSGFPLGGLSPDQTLVAYGLHSDSAPGLIQDGFYVKDLVHFKQTYIAFNPFSNRGGGGMLFSPDNTLVTWLEASNIGVDGLSYRMRVSRVDGTSLIDSPVTSLIGLTGGETPLSIQPVGWLDDHLLLIQVRLASHEKPLLLAWAPDPDQPLDPLLGSHQSFLLAEGLFMGFIYPTADPLDNESDTGQPPSYLALTDEGSLPGVFSGEMAAHDGLLYVAAGEHGFRIYDLSPDPTVPREVGALTENPPTHSVYEVLPDFNPVTLALKGATAYLSSLNDGIYQVDISTPSAPRFVDYYFFPQPVADITMRDLDAAWTSYWYGLVYDPRGSAGLSVFRDYRPGLVNAGTYQNNDCHVAWDVAVYENITYLLCEYSGLQVLNTPSDAILPVLAGSWQIDTPSPYNGGIRLYQDILLDQENKRLYLSITWDGVYVLDISNPTQPVVQAVIKTPGAVTSLAVSDNVLYTTEDSPYGLTAVDISDIHHPLVLTHLDLPASPRFITVVGQYIYLDMSGQGMRLVKITSP